VEKKNEEVRIILGTVEKIFDQIKEKHKD